MTDTIPEHAIYGGSNAERLIECPGALNEIAKLPERDRNPQSKYADEGTAAHGLCQTCLTEDTDADDYRGTFVPGEMIVDGEIAMYEVNDEMIDSVQEHVDCARGHLERLGPSAKMFIEQRVFPIVEDGRFYGRADVIIVEELVHCEMVVIDFKYGRGVVVEVVKNYQARFYGLGSLQTAPNVLNVRNVIVQPRAYHPEGHIREEKIPAEELRKFAGILIEAAALSEDPNAPLKAGKKWCMFCPAKGKCPEIQKIKKQVVQADFADLVELEAAGKLPGPSELVTLPDEEDLEELQRLWLMIPYLDYAISGINGMVQRRVEQGLDFPSAKMVRKRARRRWKDEDAIEHDAINAVRRVEAQLGIKIGRAAIYEPRKMKSPAGLDKYSYKEEGAKRGKLVLKPFVKEACEKIDGGLTLVRMDDSREAIPQETLAEKFAEEIKIQKQLQAGKDAGGEETL